MLRYNSHKIYNATKLLIEIMCNLFLILISVSCTPCRQCFCIQKKHVWFYGKARVLSFVSTCPF